VVLNNILIVSMFNSVTLEVKKDGKEGKVNFLLRHDKHTKTYVFDKKSQVINVGRSKKAEISYQVNGMSKIQCRYIIF